MNPIRGPSPTSVAAANASASVSSATESSPRSVRITPVFSSCHPTKPVAPARLETSRPSVAISSARGKLLASVVRVDAKFV